MVMDWHTHIDKQDIITATNQILMSKQSQNAYDQTIINYAYRYTGKHIQESMYTSAIIT